MVRPAEISVHSIELCLDSRLENLDLLGAAVSGIAASLGFGDSGRYHLELCAVEAVSNSIRHAYHSVPGNPVRVRIAVDGERIEMRVANQGTPMPEEQRVPPALEAEPSSLDELAEGGRGIFLMCSLMDEVVFGSEDGWSFVTLTKRRQR